MTQEEWIQLITPANMAIANVIFILLVAWSLAWKGVALWTAARKASKVWFVILLLVNTLGILEILYIFIFSKMGNKTEPKLEN